jgi:Domain of unknown function (DUF397)
MVNFPGTVGAYRYREQIRFRAKARSNRRWLMLNANERAAVAWHISTRSANGGGQCVEAGPMSDDSGRIAVRHSHRPHGDLLLFSATAWRGFLADIKAKTFDLPS